VWVYEIGEMQQFGRAEAAAVKQFVSSRVDHYRPPYGRRTSTFRARPSSPARSTSAYLRDWTGNTRFHPVAASRSGEIDLDGLPR
jgi:predicted P-loop ATPase